MKNKRDVMAGNKDDRMMETQEEIVMENSLTSGGEQMTERCKQTHAVLNVIEQESLRKVEIGGRVLSLTLEEWTTIAPLLNSLGEGTLKYLMDEAEKKSRRRAMKLVSPVLVSAILRSLVGGYDAQ